MDDVGEGPMDGVGEVALDSVGEVAMDVQVRGEVMQRQRFRLGFASMATIDKW
jgi:hypothetical protein